jgi:glycosyltransferase involved in cell wall biosynthesis
MRRLAIIPNDPIDLYLSSGYDAAWLRRYFNPGELFDEVYSLSPYEGAGASAVGVIAEPTPAAELAHRLRALRIDVARAYGGAHPCAIACAAKTDGVPVIVSVHDARPSLLDPLIREADVVLCVSDTVKRLAMTAFPRPDRVWLLPNRVSFEEMRQYGAVETVDVSARYPFTYSILHVGRKSPEKNLANLIRSLRLLGPEYGLVAIGKGSSAAYEQVAAEEGVSARCVFLDAVSNRELARYYSWATCCCMPSRTEAMCSVAIEALACGSMVVASDIPAFRECIVDGRNGLLIRDYEDPAAIAAALRTACTNQAVRETTMRQARRSVERFEQRRIDALEASYYERVLAMRDAGAFAASFGARCQRRLRRATSRLYSAPGASPWPH